MKPKFIPVFSGGTGRSGTTLIGKILGKHPRVHAGRPYEIKFLTGRDGLLDPLGDNLNSEQSQKSNVKKFSTFLNSSLRPNATLKRGRPSRLSRFFVSIRTLILSTILPICPFSCP